MSRAWILFFGWYHVLLALLVIYLLVMVWPPSVVVGGDQPPRSIRFLERFLGGHLEFSVSTEGQVLLVVLLAGALGSYVHGATSFADFTGTRRITASWRWWYVLRPFIGMTLALGFYFAVRAGFFAAGSAAFNLVGFAAMAFLVGMFTRQATHKLAEVFDTLFRVPAEYQPQRDKLQQQPDQKPTQP